MKLTQPVKLPGVPVSTLHASVDSPSKTFQLKGSPSLQQKMASPLQPQTRLSTAQR